MRKLAWLYIVLLLVTLLAACGPDTTARQTTGNAANTPDIQATTPPTPTPSAGGAISINAHQKPTPTPRPPTPTPTPKPAGGNGSNGGSSGGTNGGGGGSTTTGQPSALEQQLLQTINQDRAANGLPAYAWEPRLQKSGYQHNLVMAGGCGLSHQCSGEPALGTRISNQGVNWTSCGENIGTGGPVQATSSSQWSMVSTLHKDMMGEQPPNDGHRKNLLSSSFHRIGISIYVDANNSLWLTEDFAS